MLSAKRLILAVGFLAICLGARCPVASAEPKANAPTSIALTMTKPAAAGKEEPLAENLLSLVELAVQEDQSLAIVERRQIDLALQELVLNQSRPGNSQLQLGKLITADFLAMLELLPPDKDSQKPWARLRVVDPKAGSIRGVSIAVADEATLEETAEQFARYVSAVVRSPDKPQVTVAVAPFESQGRFDRLRPLELGIRDLVTVRLLELSGAAASGENRAAAEQATRFQVLERSNLDQLLREQELIQSGLADKSHLPETPPARGAAYLVRGEIDERQVDGQQADEQQADVRYTIVVRGQLVDAATRKVVDTFEFESPPRELERKIAAGVDRLGERLCKDEKIAQPARAKGTFEVESLKQRTLAELRRIRRNDPIALHDLFFHLPGQNRFVAARGGEKRVPRTPILLHVLHKSVDRLESILFIRPDDAEAAYALGFCYSIHEADLYRPQRADEMLRKAYALDPESPLAVFALHYLAQIDFDDRSAELIAGQESPAIERMWFAFSHMPEEYAGESWLLLRALGRLHQSPQQNRALADLIVRAAPFAENAPPDDRKTLGMAIQELAVQLARQAKDQPELKGTALELLQRWADGGDKELAYWGRTGLTTLSADRKDFFTAAGACEATAALLVDLSSPKQRDRHDAQLIEAAKLYRCAGDAGRALKLLESFEVRFPLEKDREQTDDLLGLHAYEIGRCQEMLEQPEKALAAYLHAAEINPTIARTSDVTRRIAQLGGVPLDKDRDVDVKYYDYAQGDRQSRGFNMHLATDGSRLYLGSEQGVRSFDVESDSWEPTTFPSQGVSRILASDGKLLVGTKEDGLWQCDVSSDRWRRVCPLDQLPDPHVVSLAVDGGDIYVGVGTKSSGGLVRIDCGGELHIFNEPNAPPVAPTHIVVAKHRIFACTAEAVYEWSIIAETWLRRDAGRFGRHGPPELFAGSSAIWASGKGCELAKWQASEQENARFRPAWYIPDNNKDSVVHYVQHGYTVNFLSEHDGEVWFGGQPWAPLVSSGLYRFRLKTGEFHKFSPADGFKTTTLQHVYEGVWLDDRLWLTTNAGLCVVTSTRRSSVAKDSPRSR